MRLRPRLQLLLLPCAPLAVVAGFLYGLWQRRSHVCMLRARVYAGLMVGVVGTGSLALVWLVFTEEPRPMPHRAVTAPESTAGWGGMLSKPLGRYEEPPRGTTRYVTPHGTGTTCTAIAPCTVAEALRQATCGDTIQMGAGVYAGAGNMIAPPPGTGQGCTGNPITIQGAAQGGSILDARGTSGLIPVKLQRGVENITIDGIMAAGEGPALLRSDDVNTTIRHSTFFATGLQRFSGARGLDESAGSINTLIGEDR